MLDILCIVCPSCCSVYIRTETPKSCNSKVAAKVSPRKCRPWLGVVGSDEDDDKNSDIEDTTSDVIPASPISLLSKGTMQC